MVSEALDKSNVLYRDPTHQQIIEGYNFNKHFTDEPCDISVEHDVIDNIDTCE